MTARRDDDALSWDGDDDPTLDVGVEAPQASERPVGPERGETLRAVAPPADHDDIPAGLGNVALVSLGLIAGAYLLFTIGWIIAGLRLQSVEGLPVAVPLLTVATVVAAAAPPLWFATTVALTRGSRPWVRFAWLLAGLVLLVPWPFLFTGAI